MLKEMCGYLQLYYIKMHFKNLSKFISAVFRAKVLPIPKKGQYLRPTAIERKVNRSSTTTNYICNAGYSNSNYLPIRSIQIGPLLFIEMNVRTSIGGIR